MLAPGIGWTPQGSRERPGSAWDPTVSTTPILRAPELQRNTGTLTPVLERVSYRPAGQLTCLGGHEVWASLLSFLFVPTTTECKRLPGRNMCGDDQNCRASRGTTAGDVACRRSLVLHTRRAPTLAPLLLCSPSAQHGGGRTCMASGLPATCVSVRTCVYAYASAGDRGCPSAAPTSTLARRMLSRVLPDASAVTVLLPPSMLPIRVFVYISSRYLGPLVHVRGNALYPCSCGCRFA